MSLDVVEQRLRARSADVEGFFSELGFQCSSGLDATTEECLDDFLCTLRSGTAQDMLAFLIGVSTEGLPEALSEVMDNSGGWRVARYTARLVADEEENEANESSNNG